MNRIIIAAVVIIVVGFGIYLATNSNGESNQTEEPQNENNQSATPGPTPSPEHSDNSATTTNDSPPASPTPTQTSPQPAPSPSPSPVPNPTPPAPTPAPVTKTFNITGRNFAFSQTQITVKKGEAVLINFESADGLHNLTVEGYGVGTKSVTPGTKTSVTFTADKAGTFTYYCSVGSHRQAGMVGALIVE